MPKYFVTCSLFYQIEIEADDESEARNLAFETPLDYWRENPDETVVQVYKTEPTETVEPEPKPKP